MDLLATVIMNEKTKIPLLLLSFDAMERFSRRFRDAGIILAKMKPGLENDLKALDIDIPPDSYAFGSFLSALLYGVIFFLITVFILELRGGYEEEFLYKIATVVGIAFLLIFFVLHLIYPKIVAKKTATKENKDLLFALRDMMMMVESGVLLFDAMKSVARSDYGHASKDFEKVIKKIDAGMPEREALKQLALTSESEYMKRASWQLVNALESGATVENALTSIVAALEEQMYRDIRNYSVNLNFLMLIYMLVAAAMPALGITFLTILSTFSGVGITAQTIWIVISASLIAQIVLIGYMIATRPEIFGG